MVKLAVVAIAICFVVNSYGQDSGSQGNFIDPGPLPYIQQCSSNTQCYDYREPSKFCRLLSQGGRWTNSGCHCDTVAGTCIIEFYNPQLMWTYCEHKDGWICP